MSNDKGGEALQAIIKGTVEGIVTLGLGPLGAFAMLIPRIAKVLARPDLQATAVASLQDEIGRLAQSIDQLAGAKCDPVETLELALQTCAHYSTTASAEKRARLRNVMVNGLRDENATAIERRFFLRACSILEAEHIELLQTSADKNSAFSEEGDLGRALLVELTNHGFFQQEMSSVGGILPGPMTLRVKQLFKVTELGRRFLGYLREPE